MRIVKRLTALLLCVMLCLSATACADTTYAMTVGGEQIPTGIYLLYQTRAFVAATEHEEFNEYRTDMWSNELDGKSMADWIDDYTAELVKEYYYETQKFEEMGLALDEETIAELDTTIEQSWPGYQESYEALGIGESSFRTYVYHQAKREIMIQEYYDAETGVEPITNKDLEAHFQADYANIQYLTFKTQTEDFEEFNDAQKEEQYALAEEYLAKAKDGEDMDELLITYVNSTLSEDEAYPMPEEENTYRYMIQKDAEHDQVPEELVDAVFENNVKIGEPTILTCRTAYYMVLRTDVVEEDTDIEEMRYPLLLSLKEDDFHDLMFEMEGKYEVVINKGTVKKMKPERLEEYITTEEPTEDGTVPEQDNVTTIGG